MHSQISPLHKKELFFLAIFAVFVALLLAASMIDFEKETAAEAEPMVETDQAEAIKAEKLAPTSSIKTSGFSSTSSNTNTSPGDNENTPLHPLDHHQAASHEKNNATAFPSVDQNTPGFITADDQSRFIASKDIDELVDANGKTLFLKPQEITHFLEADFKKLAFEHSTHTVDANESLWTISKGYGISLSSIVSANRIKRADKIARGRQLKIPQFSGLYYSVNHGDTLVGLSKKYRIKISEIKKYNDIPSFLRVGMVLFLADAELNSAQKQSIFGTIFSQPLQGTVSSGYGLRKHPILKKVLFHAGTDIAADYGTPVRSIASGKVVTRGKDKGYGNYVVVQHSGGYESLYAHLSKIHVKKAQKVKRGTLIGSVGSTGLSTGPHLHLEIKKNKRYINPATFFHFKSPQRKVVYTN